MPESAAAPSGWYFFNAAGQATLAIVRVPEEESYFSVRILLDHTPEGEWSELAGFSNGADALEFAMEEAAL